MDDNELIDGSEQRCAQLHPPPHTFTSQDTTYSFNPHSDIQGVRRTEGGGDVGAGFGQDSRGDPSPIWRERTCVAPIINPLDLPPRRVSPDVVCDILFVSFGMISGLTLGVSDMRSVLSQAPTEGGGEGHEPGEGMPGGARASGESEHTPITAIVLCTRAG